MMDRKKEKPLRGGKGLKTLSHFRISTLILVLSREVPS